MIRAAVASSFAVALAVVLLIVALGGYLVYQRVTDAAAVQEEDGRIVSKVVFATLSNANELRVMRLTGSVQGVASDDGAGGVLHSTLVIKSPFAVSYFVDLKGLDRSKFLWNAKDRLLTVTVPEVSVERPDIDEANATVVRNTGVFVTRGAMNRLRTRASNAADKVAQEEAIKPARIEAARRNARKVIAELFAAPLRAAGLDATVGVRFAGDAVTEQMDRSRSLEEIYADPAAEGVRS